MGAGGRKVEHGIAAARGQILLLELLVGVQGDVLQIAGGELHAEIRILRTVQVGGGTGTAVDPHRGAVGHQSADVDHRVVAFPGGVVLGPPHIGGAEPSGVTHRDVDQDRPQAQRWIQEAGQRRGEEEQGRMPDRQIQRRTARHRQAHNGVAGGLDAPVGRQPGWQLPGKERLPLVGDGSGATFRGPVPVGVETRLAANRHHHRQPRFVVPLEGGGVDIPAAGLLLGAQSIQQVERVRTAALKLDSDIAAHRRGRHRQDFDRQALPGEGARARGRHQTGQHQRRTGCREKSARPQDGHRRKLATSRSMCRRPRGAVTASLGVSNTGRRARPTGPRAPRTRRSPVPRRGRPNSSRTAR